MASKEKLMEKFDKWITEGQELKAAIEALSDGKPAPAGRWKPEIDEYYWYISLKCLVDSTTWQNTVMDKGKYALANVYRTEEEAQAALDQQLATVRVLDRIAELNAEQGWKCDWNAHNQEKYFLCFDHDDNTSGTLGSLYRKCFQFLPTSHYGSNQTIETVIKEMESDCLLMLGVEIRDV